MHTRYPFAGIVGQEQMKKALILNVINPKIGGVLIRGEKGTAKSTGVRALIDLLPDNRVVDLPVGATEDRVVGTLDIEHALKNGEKKFEPGILAKAHNNLLYVDEVNLLDDHIVDILLDVAAMGVNVVEREGVSYSHPSKFILVGTMNPEEGDLRPQLLDRFGMTIDVKGENSVEKRVEVIKRRLAFEANPETFIQQFKEEHKQIVLQIKEAQKLLPKVKISDKMLELTAEITLDLGVDGHRADITMIKVASTIAAYENVDEVQREHILEAAELVLPHRMRRLPFDDGCLSASALDKWLEEKVC
ncbi:magnesium chelatase subunit I [Ancylomarina subtilis]|uniref:Magnesium chelatase subunit I n=1 Tax=Ancylomarina subtilis TaxID=1639035 RepID=A0A4Q7VH99_9BACT|nr:AAA family ATPase [Ancylomarina subtilis]RZT95404.1 magnesium chelatase subunit I [Ancylomarina subtilis]